MELLELAAIIILSVGLGLAGGGAILSMVLLCLTPSATRSNVAAVAYVEAAYENSAPHRARAFGLRSSAAS